MHSSPVTRTLINIPFNGNDSDTQITPNINRILVNGRTLWWGL
jgi:hypothetical protein